MGAPYMVLYSLHQMDDRIPPGWAHLSVPVRTGRPIRIRS